MSHSNDQFPVTAETFAAPGAVELAQVVRSGFIESRHYGAAVVLGHDGEVIRALGDVSSPVFARSTLKPFQAIAVMNSGVGLRDAAAALSTASHSGTARHVQVVRSMIAQAGVTEASLGCPAAYPMDRGARHDLIRDEAKPASVYMECSGKHAAFLLACVHSGWPIDSYLDPQHPLQIQVRDVIERLTGERPSSVGVDGCGAPVFAVSLTGLAKGYSRLRTSTASSPFALYRNAGILSAAVLANPWGIAGPGQTDTILAENLGVFAKFGAEGVMVVAAPNGTTVALKMLDGGGRASAPVALRLLVAAGALDADAVAAVLPQLHTAVYGGGVQVGEIRPVPGL